MDLRNMEDVWDRPFALAERWRNGGVVRQGGRETRHEHGPARVRSPPATRLPPFGARELPGVTGRTGRFFVDTHFLAA